MVCGLFQYVFQLQRLFWHQLCIFTRKKNIFPYGIQLFWNLLTSHHTWYVCRALKLGYCNGVNITYPSLNIQQSRDNNIVLCNTIFHWQNIQFIYIVLKYLCLSNAYARYMWQEETWLSQNRAYRVRHNLVSGLNYSLYTPHILSPLHWQET